MPNQENISVVPVTALPIGQSHQTVKITTDVPQKRYEDLTDEEIRKLYEDCYMPIPYMYK